jgi:hypothetical protein
MAAPAANRRGALDGARRIQDHQVGEPIAQLGLALEPPIGDQREPAHPAAEALEPPGHVGAYCQHRVAGGERVAEHDERTIAATVQHDAARTAGDRGFQRGVELSHDRSEIGLELCEHLDFSRAAGLGVAQNQPWLDHASPFVAFEGEGGIERFARSARQAAAAAKRHRACPCAA